MIPTIEIHTENVKTNYKVSEAFAYKIMSLIIKEYDLERQSEGQ